MVSDPISLQSFPCGHFQNGQPTVAKHSEVQIFWKKCKCYTFTWKNGKGGLFLIYLLAFKTAQSTGNSGECGSVWCFQKNKHCFENFLVVVNYMRPRPAKESLFNWLVVLGFIQTLLKQNKESGCNDFMERPCKKVQSVNKFESFTTCFSDRFAVRNSGLCIMVYRL